MSRENLKDSPISQYIINDVTFTTFKNKNKRIRLALKEIERNYNEACCMANGIEINNISVTKPLKNMNKPEFCRGESI